MIKREKVEQRKFFSVEEKELMRKKSNNRCCHCGKELTDDFSVEHVIPLNKGGTNDLSNMVALCQKCNLEKADLIYHPKEYYKFLQPQYVDELLANQMKYYSDVYWLAPDTLLPEDGREFKLQIIPKAVVRKVRNYSNYTVTVSVFIKKAEYKDLDMIRLYYMQYLQQVYNGVDEEKAYDRAMKELSDWFDNGVLYYIVDKTNTIKAVLPVGFKAFSVEDYSTSNEKQNGVVPYLYEPISLVDEFNYCVAIVKAYTYILANIAKCLKQPIYFIAESDGLTRMSYTCFSTLVDVSSRVLSFEKPIQGVIFARFVCYWENSDAELLSDTLSYEFVKNHTILDWTDRKAIIESHSGYEYLLDKYDSFRHGDFDVDVFNSDIEIFSHNLARRLGYRSESTPIELKPASNNIDAVVDDSIYSVVELPIDELILPEGTNMNMSIPTFVKKQVKMNCIKFIDINSFYMVSKQDIPVLLYLKQIGKKTVKCSIKKKYLSDSTDDEVFLSEQMLEYDADTRKYIHSLYMFQKDGDSRYANWKIVLEQHCKCDICGKTFSSKLQPYPVLRKPKTLGGTSSVENTVALCGSCKNYVGKLSYTEELKGLIQKEYADISVYSRSLNSEKECCD